MSDRRIRWRRAWKFAIAVVASLTVQFLAGQTTTSRDANGRLVISSVSAPPPPPVAPRSMSPAETAAQPLTAPPVMQPLIVPPPPAVDDLESPGLQSLPFSMSAGDATTSRVTLGPLPEPVALFRGADGHLFAVANLIISDNGIAPFPYHPPNRLSSLPSVVSVGVSESGNAPTPPIPEGFDRSKETLNYYPDEKRDSWQTQLPVYKSLRFRGCGPGIVLTETATALKEHFRLTIAPGTDVSKVFVKFSGDVALDVNGALIVRSNDPSGSSLLIAPPRVSQGVAGSERPIGARWTARGQGFAFLQFDAFDPGRELAVEFDLSRWALSASPMNAERTRAFVAMGAIVRDSEGNLYVATLNRVEKFDLKNNLLYTTIIGTRPADPSSLTALAPDGKGNLLFAMPSGGAHQPLTRPSDCSQDCGGILVGKLGPQGQLLESRLIAPLTPRAIAIDPRGMLYVLGKVFGYGVANGDGVAKIDPSRPSKDALVCGSNLGPIGARAITYDREGNIIVGGYSPGNVEGGAVILKIDPRKKGQDPITASTAIARGSSSGVNALAVDLAGNIYAVGYYSGFDSISGTRVDFPTTENAWNRHPTGEKDGFVCKFDPTLKAMRWSTLFGGSGENEATGVAVDQNQNVYVVGVTSSTDFPVEGGPATAHMAEGDKGNHLFAIRLNSLGTRASWSVLLGGGDYPQDAIFADRITTNRSGEAFIAVIPWRNDAPAFISSIRGGETLLVRDATFIRVSSCTSCTAPPSIDRLKAGSGGQTEILGNGFSPSSRILVNGVPSGNMTFVSPSLLRVTYRKKNPDDDVEFTVVNTDQQSATSSLAQQGGTSFWSLAGARTNGALLLGAATVAMIVVLLAARLAFRRRRKPAPITSGRPPVRRAPPSQKG